MINPEAVTPDDELEQRIAQACEALKSSMTTEQKREFFEILTWLIRDRSPQQVERMERERGLR